MVKEKLFEKGQEVIVLLHGAGVTTSEAQTILEIKDGEIWLDNGFGNDPTGPFDAKTGKRTGYMMPGFSQRIRMEYERS